MSEEHRVQDDHPGTEELALRLQAYASARLTPDRLAATRMRGALVEEARMRALRAQISGRSGASSPRRRAASLLLAAALTLASAAAVGAASAPGGPLYGTRLWIEAATLPAEANSRAVERVRQIEERLADAERAAAAGDEAGVAAAIQAYRDAVRVALEEAGSDAARLERLRLALGLQVTVLETLAGKVPNAAVNGIERAIQASQNAADRIQRGKPPIDSGQDPSGPGDPTARPGRTPAPAATDRPARTAAPEAPSHGPATSGPPTSNSADDQQG
ncbi:MAG: hypothetical protein HYX57_02440 [Chloroflexi bacterium]|nr:hypothetical protein [Chloroflexota bacterium]